MNEEESIVYCLYQLLVWHGIEASCACANILYIILVMDYVLQDMGGVLPGDEEGAFVLVFRGFVLKLTLLGAFWKLVIVK